MADSGYGSRIQRFDQFNDLRGVKVEAIGLAGTTVAHAGEVHRHDMKVVAKERCNEVPPAGMGTQAVEEEQAGLAGGGSPG
ncbi:hypothetical protein D3C72_1800290 [compost metagenome]